jgi:hypothetical protein
LHIALVFDLWVSYKWGMEDSTILRVRAKIAAAEAEAERWRVFLRDYVELNQMPAPVVSGVIERTLPVAAAFRSAQPHGVKMTATERIAWEIIKDAGRAVPSAEMLQLITERVGTPGGKDPAATLAARLSRAPSLKFERGFGWTLKAPQPLQDEAAGPAPESKEPAAGNVVVEHGEVGHDNINH